MHEHFRMKVELCRIRRELLGLPLTPVPRQDIPKHGCKGLGIPKDPSSMVDQGALPFLEGPRVGLERLFHWVPHDLSMRIDPVQPPLLSEDPFGVSLKKGIAPRIVTHMKEASLLEKYGLLL